MQVNSNNGLSSTMVIRYIDSQLGSTVQTIELTPKNIMDVVYQQSLYTFSQFYPFLPTVVLTQKDAIQKDGDYFTQFRIPNPWNVQILSLHKFVISSNAAFGNGWIAPFLTNPIDSLLLNDRMSQFITPTILEFIPPNKIILKQNFYQLSDKDLWIQFKAVHPRHLKTVEANLRDEFLHLCLDDVLISLYPIRHRFQTITTPYGSLQPFFDLVDGAKADREALIQKWRDNPFNGERKILWLG